MTCNKCTELQAQRFAYASEFDGDQGSIHQNIRALKAENDKLRTIINAPNSDIGNEFAIVCHFKEQLDNLQAENLQMREALGKIIAPSENDHQDYEVAEACLKNIPHTQKLADRIKALEEVTEAFRKYGDGPGAHQALSKLDALEKK